MVPIQSLVVRQCRQLSKDLKLDGGNGNKKKKPQSKKNKKGPENGGVFKGKGKKPKSAPKGKPSKKERVARKGKTSAPANSDAQLAEPAGSKPNPKRRKATWTCTWMGNLTYRNLSLVRKLFIYIYKYRSIYWLFRSIVLDIYIYILLYSLSYPTKFDL